VTKLIRQRPRRIAATDAAALPLCNPIPNATHRLARELSSGSISGPGHMPVAQRSSCPVSDLKPETNSNWHALTISSCARIDTDIIEFNRVE
jgi:hypothetical protein